MNGRDPLARAKSYVESVVSLAQIESDVVVSVILFGSYVKGGFSERSDVDVILVVRDDCKQTDLRRLEQALERQEEVFGFSQSEKSLRGRLYSALLRQTGMFSSHFVTRESDLVGRDFSRIFSTNRAVASFIAPADIVIASVFSSAKTVFGRDLLTGLPRPEPVGLGQLARSLTMNLLLATGAFVISPFSKRAVDLSLEATKWSLLNTYYFVFGTNPGIGVVAEKFVSRGIAPSIIRRTTRLRSSAQRDPSFVLAAPLAVVLLTLSASRLSGH